MNTPGRSFWPTTALGWLAFVVLGAIVAVLVIALLLAVVAFVVQAAKSG